jgi:ABC-2 type transport system ATP-binding protein
VALMHRGRIRALGTPDELVVSLDGAGDSLDDVFRSYTGQELDEGGFRDVRVARHTARRVG